MLANLPILGVCGRRGCGGGALLEQVLAALRGRGLEVALARRGTVASQTAELLRLAERNDLVLLEGGEGEGVAKVWLSGSDGDGPPEATAGVIATLPPGADRLRAFLTLLEDWLAARWGEVPVFGCVLIGGKSQRMGRPKHLIVHDGTTWLARTAALLRQVCRQVVAAGAGELPDDARDCRRLQDAEAVQGPLAGILAAMRSQPLGSWLVAACDLPDLSVEALRWLLSTRRPGVWGTMPKLPEADRPEPLLAHYDFRMRPVFEALSAQGDLGPGSAAGGAKVITPRPPPQWAGAWRNVNTPEDLE